MPERQDEPKERTMRYLPLMFLFACAAPPPADCSTLNLQAVEVIGGKGRLQDAGNQDLALRAITERGIDAVPCLIDRLDDERRLELAPINLKADQREADLAFLLLFDLFHTRAGEPTVPALSEEKLIGGDPQDSFWDRYDRLIIQKEGRNRMKALWKAEWERNRARLYWDATERVVRLRDGSGLRSDASQAKPTTTPKGEP